jgi:hypothetical protein
VISPNKTIFYISFALGMVLASTQGYPQVVDDWSRIDCSDRTYTTVTGTIDSVDLEDPATWLIHISQDQLGGCGVDSLTVNKRPGQACREGRKVTASGSVSSNAMLVDSLSCR